MIILNYKIDTKQIAVGIIFTSLLLSGFPIILELSQSNYNSNLSTESSYRENSTSFNSQKKGGNSEKLIEKRRKDWYSHYYPYDLNKNGLNDVLDRKLNSSENPMERGDEFQIYDKKMTLGQELSGKIHNRSDIVSTDIEYENDEVISIIVQFPGSFKDKIIQIFKLYNGEIVKVYKRAINGFLGRIKIDDLYNFMSYLRSKDLPFFIEEDEEVKGNLYYTGRNMNLRPYVWDTLGYDGDEWSSIAIIDTGIDDSHNFHDGFNNASFDHKIVGWKDFINSSTNHPYDDNSHGTHVSGIAAGDGNNPSQSENYRYFFTKNLVIDGTGDDYYNGTFSFNVAKFNLLNDTKDISVEYWFDDYTTSADDMNLTAILLYNDTVIHSYTNPTQDDWYSNRINGIETEGSIGTYTLRLNLSYIDLDGDGLTSSPNISFRGLIYWPFEPKKLNSGNIFRGVANDTHLVGIKALDETGSGTTSGIIDSIEWAISNKHAYNITIISMSLGTRTRISSLDNAVNYAVEEGILTVVAAGNDGPGGNYVASPASAENSLAVAATNFHDNITHYSSEGGDYDSRKTSKPDIAAPGGSVYDHNTFSSDTNDNDAEGLYSERVYNDLTPLQGTSMAAPAVSGAANLLIEAMGGHKNWEYSATQAKLVKALLLMTATETYPLIRETYGLSSSPQLNRGGKDPHEGYGRINPDMAIEAFTKELKTESTASKFISSSFLNPFAHHGLARKVKLDSNRAYLFSLDTPSSADFDLYLYKGEASEYGEPILINSSISSIIGKDEEIHFSPEFSGTFYLVAKAISGQGEAKISKSTVEDLSVSLNVPFDIQVNKSHQIKAELEYLGENAKKNVSFSLLLDGNEINSTIISEINSGDSFTFTYDFISSYPDIFNFTAYTSYLDNESNTLNNKATEILASRIYFFYEDFENNLSKWETVDDEWHITSDSSGRPDSSYSPTHSIWHGNETTGYYNNQYDNRNNLISDPINLSIAGSELYLEFFHWRETLDYWDESRVGFLLEGSYRNFTYYIDSFNDNIDAWDKEIYNISSLAGRDNVRLKFTFQIIDSSSKYRGWLIDNIKIYGNLDDIPPEWIESPTNQTAYTSRNFYYDLNATDPTGISRYWINDTDNFTIDNTGLLTNNGSSEEGIYWLELRSYDSYNNFVSAIVKITVEPSIQFIPGFEPIILVSVLGLTAIIIVLIRRKAISINQ